MMHRTNYLACPLTYFFHNVESVSCRVDHNWVDNTGRRIFPQLVVWNYHMLIFHLRIRVCTRYDHSWLVPIKSRMTLLRSTLGPQHILHGNIFFCCYPACTELCRVSANLNGDLTFAIPNYRGLSDKSHDIIYRSPRHLITGMVGVKLNLSANRTPLRLRESLSNVLCHVWTLF